MKGWIHCLCCAALLSVQAAETPLVTVNAATREVRITYALSSPAIVTLCLESNASGSWQAVPAEETWTLAGDVNRSLAAGTHEVVWRPSPTFDLSGSLRATLNEWSAANPPLYLAVSLEAKGVLRYYADERSVPFGVTDDRYKSAWLLLRRIPAKGVSWRMGACAGDVTSGLANETACNQHQTSFSHDYYMAVYETTQQQHLNVTGANPSYFVVEGATRPVEKVSYATLRGAVGDSPSVNWPATDRSVVSTGSVIRKWRDLTGIDLDLPTEAEWEYAARAGSGGSYYGPSVYFGKNETYLKTLGRYLANNKQGNSTDDASKGPDAGGTARVGSYQPNPWGLYDMLGNVGELVLDWYSASGYPDEAIDPQGVTTGSNRVWRGGCWKWNCYTAHLSARKTATPTSVSTEFGYRLCCAIVP